MLKNQRGFTLIELLVSIGVISLILTTAIPSFIDFIGRARSESVTDAFDLDIQMARTLSISSGQSVQLEFNQKLGVHNWTITQDGKTIKTNPIKYGNYTPTMYIVSSSGKWDYVDAKLIFHPDGYLTNDSNEMVSWTYVFLCDKDSHLGKTFKFSPLGKITSEESTC